MQNVLNYIINYSGYKLIASIAMPQQETLIMLPEKIIKRDDGTEVQIRVDFYVDLWGSHWSQPTISIKDKGKTKFYFTLYYTESLVTKQEILDAKMDLWNKLKPSL